MDAIEQLLSSLWEDYLALNPQARQIKALLEGRGEKVVNDHIALRTLNQPGINVEALSQRFLRHGFRRAGEYLFGEKKLFAAHFQHDYPEFPKIFISELQVEAFSPEFQALLQGLIRQMPVDATERDDLFVMGRPWKLSYASYERLAKESEYAAWFAAHGFRVNHFTVLVNALRTVGSLQDLNRLLHDHGFPLNQSGGEIKGAPDVHLEQSSTMANEIPVTFDEGTVHIPGCYYEFARRYKLPNGKYYQGFIARSADKIFESTDRHSHQPGLVSRDGSG